MKNKKRTLRLAGSYLAVIMTLSIIFSVIIFTVYKTQINKEPLPAPHDHQFSQSVEDEFSNRISLHNQQTLNSIIASLVGLNIFMLFMGSFVSYFLARKTLKPIELTMESQARFVSDASHELRTPLTVLQMNNELALRKNKISEEKSREIFSRNVAEVQKMKTLTNDLLQLSQIEAEKFKKTKFKLSKTIDEILETHSDLAKKANIEIQNDVKNTEIISFEPALRQILKVLIDNAIKYSPENSKIKIYFEKTQFLSKTRVWGFRKKTKNIFSKDSIVPTKRELVGKNRDMAWGFR